MKTDPVITEAPKAVRKCPNCSGTEYAVTVDHEQGELRCIDITCQRCGFDILKYYRKIYDA